MPRGFEILVGRDRLFRVPDAIADAYQAGDALLAAEQANEVVHVLAAERAIARNAVGRADGAFSWFSCRARTRLLV